MIKHLHRDQILDLFFLTNFDGYVELNDIRVILDISASKSRIYM